MKFGELRDHIEDAILEVEGDPTIDSPGEAADFIAEWLTTETALVLPEEGDELPTSTSPGGSSEHAPGT